MRRKRLGGQGPLQDLGRSTIVERHVTGVGPIDLRLVDVEGDHPLARGRKGQAERQTDVSASTYDDDVSHWIIPIVSSRGGLIRNEI
jgi:hypothetical protein